MSVIENLDVLEDESPRDRQLRLKRERMRRYRKESAQRRKEEGYSRTRLVAPPMDCPFVIAPKIAPHLIALAEKAGLEAGLERRGKDELFGINVLAARAATILGVRTDSLVRRLWDVMMYRTLFTNARLVEACLMAMDAEHEVQYAEWPSSKAQALERVSIEAELRGKKVSPDKLLAQANDLYYKGVRRAFRRAGELKF